MRRAFFAIALLAGSALAQNPEMQRELIRRDQQSDAFKLQLQQSQERLHVAPGDLRRGQAVDARQLDERQRLEATSERQIQDLARDMPAELQPLERERLRRERLPLAEPSPPPDTLRPEPPRRLPMP